MKLGPEADASAERALSQKLTASLVDGETVHFEEKMSVFFLALPVFGWEAKRKTTILRGPLKKTHPFDLLGVLGLFGCLLGACFLAFSLLAP